MELFKGRPRNNRERIIESEFGWLRDVKEITVDGKRMMINDETNRPFNVAMIMDEKYFVENWLMLFALGRENGLNYFPTDEWIEISGDGLQSVMVVDKDKKPLFLVPPLVATNMGPKELKMMRNLEHAIKQIAADEQLKHLPHASAHLAHDVEDALVDVKPKMITDMVPGWFYDRHGIIPLAEKQVNYIRQRINFDAPIEELNRSREIFYKVQRNEAVTKEEKEFITKLTRGEYSFGNTPVNEQESAAEQKANDEPDEEFDPLSC